MDLVPYLSAVILISTIATIALAVFSYAAFKMRDKRKPKGNAAQQAPVFFHRYRPPEPEAPADPEGGDGGSAA